MDGQDGQDAEPGERTPPTVFASPPLTHPATPRAAPKVTLPTNGGLKGNLTETGSPRTLRG